MEPRGLFSDRIRREARLPLPGNHQLPADSRRP